LIRTFEDSGVVTPCIGRVLLRLNEPPIAWRNRRVVRHLERPVRRVEGDLEEEGLTGILFDELHRSFCEEIGRVAGHVHRLTVLEQIVIAARISVLVVVDEPALEAEEVIEPVTVGTELRLVAQVPLANESRAITVVLQQLWKGAARRSQPLVLRGARGAERILNAISLLVAAADEHRPRRRAVRRGVEVGQPHPVLREAVDVGRLDVWRPIAADVPIADVVSDDEDHVWPRGLSLRGGRRSE
jgi:hypothetical protein